MQAIVVLLLIVTASQAPASDTRPDVQTVAFVDLDRYAGRWYEIARYPNRFQRDCAGATAEYARKTESKIRVLNTCYTAEGRVRAIEGEAKVVDDTNARLEVKFNNWFFKLFSWLVKGDYWVIDLAEDYSHAVVGTPSRKYLWILSREPEMAEDLYQSLLQKVAAQGFEREKIIRTQVPAGYR